MSVELESKNRIANLISAANAKTGNADTDLTTAVGSLIAGFGQGGGDSDLLKSIVEGTATDLSFGEYITEIKFHLFENVSSLASFDFTHIKVIRGEAFKGCTGLTELYLPAISSPSSQGARAFQNCTGLKNVDMPNMTNFYSSSPGWFSGCTALECINLPKMVDLNAQLLEKCSSLKKLDLPEVASIQANSMNGCSSLNTLILRSANVVTLINVSAFTSTPFASGGTGGTVYVPAALIEAYQTATNWSTLYAAGTCNFVAIEGSEYE